ncbi:hypothetical protein JCM10207_005139 [Rhodosporidiobolus poonsookiae]
MHVNASEGGWMPKERMHAPLPPETASHDLSPTFSSPTSLYSHHSSTSGSDTVTATSPTIQPIAISDSTTFAAPRPFPPAFASTSSGSELSGSFVDGPLHDLLPALSVSASVSSSEDSAISAWHGRPAGLPTAGRRVVSGPSTYFTSPSRSSPLSRSVDMSSPDEPSWPSRRPPPFGLPALATSPTDSFDSSRLSSSRRRRRSSASFSSITHSQTPPFGSFVGSFENSLLSGRMSALPSIPLPFVASIGVLGSANTPLRLRCPQHLHVPFTAVFYSPPGEVSASTPYVGTIDLEAHYLSLLNPTGDAAALDPLQRPAKLPRFPGYAVPVKGQVQLVLKNGNRTSFKPFLIPYDLTGLERGGKGGRTFLRQKSYAVDDFDTKGKLRFAVHLQFCSPPRAPTKKGKAPDEPRYYLHHSIRVVFASRGLDASDKLRVVLEGPDDLMYGSSSSAPRPDSDERFGAYLGPGPDWELARKKAKEREKMRASLPPSVPPPAAPAPPPFPDSAATAFDTLPPLYPASLAPAFSSIPPSAPIPAPSSAFAPSFACPAPCHPAVRSAAATPEPLTFERIPSPHLPPFLDPRERKLSVSGLSASRPASRNEGSARTSSSERCGR